MEISESLINGESGKYLRIREKGRETSFPLTIKGVRWKFNVKIAKKSLKRTILAWSFAIYTEKMVNFLKDRALINGEGWKISSKNKRGGSNKGVEGGKFFQNK